jgi:hypothetical protein
MCRIRPTISLRSGWHSLTEVSPFTNGVEAIVEATIICRRPIQAAMADDEGSGAGAGGHSQNLLRL